MKRPHFALLEMVDAFCMNSIMKSIDFTKAMVSITTIEPNLFNISVYGDIPDEWVYDDDDYLWSDDPRYEILKEKYEERFSE